MCGVADNNPNNNGLYGISEFTKSELALSPTNFVSTGKQAGGYVKALTYFNGPRGISVDPSGNVWTYEHGQHRTIPPRSRPSWSGRPFRSSRPLYKQLSSVSGTTVTVGSGPIKP